MAIERIGKSPELTNKGIVITPIGRCHLRRAHAQEVKPLGVKRVQALAFLSQAYHRTQSS